MSSIALQTLAYMAALSTCCMVCHGETYRLRPAPAKLTAFYLSIAAGGALGGFLVAIVAPLVFSAYWELYIAMPLCLGLGLAAIRPTGPKGPQPFRPSRALGFILAAVTGAVLLSTDRELPLREETLARTRSFYGVLRVVEVALDTGADRKGREWVIRVLRNGPTNHGVQVFDVLGAEHRSPTAARANSAPPPVVAQARLTPTSYYGPATGGGIAMRFHADDANRPRTIGVIGLGAGTMALYGQPGDTIRYYEINPDVAVAADQYFTFLADARARGVNVEIKLGDGRLLLQKEPSRSLDILVVDAFTGDAVPVHLLTREAFQLYLDRLREDGVLALHVTNRHLDLQRAVIRVAEALGTPAAVVKYRPNPRDIMQVGSEWVLLTSNPRLLADPAIQPYLVDSLADARKVSLWTDEFSSVLQVLQPHLQ